VSAVIRCEPISEAAFSPFGLVLHRPSLGEPRVNLQDELQNGRTSAKPRLTIATAPPRELPLTATKMERHVFSSQTFTPIDCASYLVLVAPQGDGGLPDVARIRAFQAPGDVGVHYFADTWHHPLTALDRPGSFVVLTFIDGGPTDEQWFTLPAALTIAA
jgi:ureidoglycolate lyase